MVTLLQSKYNTYKKHSSIDKAVGKEKGDVEIPGRFITIFVDIFTFIRNINK